MQMSDWEFPLPPYELGRFPRGCPGRGQSALGHRWLSRLSHWGRAAPGHLADQAGPPGREQPPS